MVGLVGELATPSDGWMIGTIGTGEELKMCASRSTLLSRGGS